MFHSALSSMLLISVTLTAASMSCSDDRSGQSVLKEEVIAPLPLNEVEQRYHAIWELNGIHWKMIVVHEFSRQAILNACGEGWKLPNLGNVTERQSAAAIYHCFRPDMGPAVDLVSEDLSFVSLVTGSASEWGSYQWSYSGSKIPNYEILCRQR